INSPATVASFLQRLGRTGRRPGGSRNCLFLTMDGEALAEAAALLLLWSRGWVEPVTAPPEPRHIVAQQILALSLQEHRLGSHLWAQAWNGLHPFDEGAQPIVRHLVEHEYLDQDGGMLFIGPAAEQRFGRRHFMEMTAVFTGPPEFTVLLGRNELGRIDPRLLTEEVRGERRLLLAGRSWRVTYIDWRRRRCFVQPADSGGRARWTGGGWAFLGFELIRAIRDVLLGTDPPVRLTRRATERLARERAEKLHLGVFVFFTLLGWGVNAWTDWLWFDEVRYTQVFTGVLATRLLLFLVIGLGMAAIVAGNLWLAYRLRPQLRPHSAEQATLERYRMLLSPRLGTWIALASAVIGLFAGLSAQSRWSQWLLFRNGGSFGVKDPEFGIDVGFYVFQLPFWRYLLGVGFTAVVLALLGALAVHYIFGGVRLQGVGDRMTNAARAHLSSLVAVFVVLKAIAYVLDQR
ncbi:UPF0182 family protein, partial [Streptomyces sp. NPDC003333]